MEHHGPGCLMCDLTGFEKWWVELDSVECSVVHWSRVLMSIIQMTQPGEILCGDALILHFPGSAQHGAFLLPEVPLDLKSLLGFLMLIPAPAILKSSHPCLVYSTHRTYVLVLSAMHLEGVQFDAYFSFPP